MFHIIGLVLWVGGTLMLARALAVAVGEKTEFSAVRSWAWRGFAGYVLPGAVIKLRLWN